MTASTNHPRRRRGGRVAGNNNLIGFSDKGLCWTTTNKISLTAELAGPSSRWRPRVSPCDGLGGASSSWSRIIILFVSTRVLRRVLRTLHFSCPSLFPSSARQPRGKKLLGRYHASRWRSCVISPRGIVLT